MKRYGFVTRGGFTLIELLVVIAIIAVLVGLVLPAVQKVRESANRASCANNLKQLALACLNYESEHAVLPVGGLLGDGNWHDGGADWSWIALTLPHLEQHALYQQCAIPTGDIKDAPPAALGKVIRALLCPSDPSGPAPATSDDSNPNLNAAHVPVAKTNYFGNGGSAWNPAFSDPCGGNPYGENGTFGDPNKPDGVFAYSYAGTPPYLDPGVRIAEITDGTSNTFLIGEQVADPNVMAGGYTWPVSNASIRYAAIPLGLLQDTAVEPPCWTETSGFGGRHPNGTQFAFADGSVHYLSYGTAQSVVFALSSRAGGEQVDVP